MGIIDQIGLNHLMVPLLHGVPGPFAETWQDPIPPGIDAGLWTRVVTGTGAIAQDLTEIPYHKILMTGPTNGGTARIYSNHRWTVAPRLWGANHIYKRFLFMWEAKIATVASVNNPTFFMGLASTIAATRATDDMIGFILTADAINTFTDDGGAETITVPAVAPAVANWHLYGIEVYPGGIAFYIDGALAAAHIVNMPDIAFYLTWYFPQEAGANGGQLSVGPLGCNYELVLR